MINSARAALASRPDWRSLSPTAVVCGTYLLGLASAELLLLSAGLAAGAVAMTVLVTGLLMHALAAPDAPYRRLLIVLLLPPLIRLFGLAIPVAATPSAIWYLMAGTPALLAAALAARVTGLPPRLLDWPSRSWAQLLIATSGVSAGLLGYLALQPEPVSGGTGMAIATGASLIVFSAGLEELVFRGSMQTVVAETLGSETAGLTVTAAAFAFMYIGAPSFAFTLVMLSMGLFLGWAVQQTGSLWGSIAAHAVMIVGLVVVWPLLLS